MPEINVDEIFETIKEFDPHKFASASQHEQEGWPLLVHPLDQPDSVSVAEAREWLRDDDYVLGLTVNGKSRAYPLVVPNYYHQVNDVLGGDPVLIND